MCRGVCQLSHEKTGRLVFSDSRESGGGGRPTETKDAPGLGVKVVLLGVQLWHSVTAAARVLSLAQPGSEPAVHWLALALCGFMSQMVASLVSYKNTLVLMFPSKKYAFHS